MKITFGTKKKFLIVPAIIIVLLIAVFVTIHVETANAASFTSTTLTKPIQAAGVASDGTLYAGSYGMVYRSTDRGQTWSSVLISIPNADDISCIFVASNGYIYFSPVGSSVSSMDTGLWRSTNQGQSWSRVISLPTSECIWGIDQDTNGNLYAGVYTIGMANSDARIYKSTNNGASWTSVYYDSAARHVHCVRVDKSDNYIYASVGDSLAPWYTNYVIRSINGGSSWSQILTSMPQVVAIEAAQGARFFGSDSATGQVFKTTDDNSYTTVLNTGTYSNCFWIRKSDVENKIIAGFCGAEGSPRSAGIYASTDGGSSWTLGESLPTNQAFDGTTAASNYVGGILYHDVVFNGVVQNGECLDSGNPSPSPTPTPTTTATPTPTPTPTPIPTPTPSPPSGYLFTADFESGSFSEYKATGGDGYYSQSVETGNPYKGSYDAKFTAGANSEGWAYQSISSSAITYYRQLIKIGTLPTSGNYICLGSIQNTNSQNTVDPFIYNSNGQYYWGAVSVVNGNLYWDRQSTASNPTTGTYYTLEVCRDVTNHRTCVWVDGDLKLNVTRQHSGNSNRICTGISWADSSTTIYVDCVRVNSSYIGLESQPNPTPTPTPTPTPSPLTPAVQINANVTVTMVNFNQTTSTLNMTIVKNGVSSVQAVISKTSLPSITNFKVYVNTVQTTYAYTSNSTHWQINFTVT